MFKVVIPYICIEEQKYILDIILNEFLGLEYVVETHDRDQIEISKLEDVDKSTKITIDASFFHLATKNWLKQESLPRIPLAIWKPNEGKMQVNLIDQSLPVLYGLPGVQITDKHIHINIDIFGSCFFMLSRYEELIIKTRDSHDRFPAWESVAYKAGFLDRPIVNEYLEVLWSCISHIWPNVSRIIRKSKFYISADVDQPFDSTVENIYTLIKTCVGDIVKRKSLVKLIKRVNRYIFNKIGIYCFDQNNSFKYYMDICEQAGLKATFYFIPTSYEQGNGNYELHDPRIIKIMKRIYDRGHEIGVHGSYQTYKDKEKMCVQKSLFESILVKAGIKQKILGNRQHYLRWDSSVTPDYLNNSKFEYDTSGSYADIPGFRFGTSLEFSMWGWQNYSKLKIKQRPLIVMECTVISEAYVGLGYSEYTVELIQKLKLRSFLSGGSFSLLWHNSNLNEYHEKNLFEKLLLH